MQLALSDPVELPPLQIINIAAVMQPPAIFRELTIANDVWMKHTNFWTVFFSWNDLIRFPKLYSESYGFLKNGPYLYLWLLNACLW